MTRSKIPPRLEDAVWEKYQEAQSYRDVSAWLLTEHKIVASYNAVKRIVKRRIDDKRAIAQAIVRTELGKSIRADIRHLDRDIDRLEAAIVALVKLREAKEHGILRKEFASELVRYIEQKTRIIALRAKLAGADAEVEPSVVVDELHRELDALGERLRKAPAPLLQ